MNYGHRIMDTGPLYYGLLTDCGLLTGLLTTDRPTDY